MMKASSLALLAAALGAIAGCGDNPAGGDGGGPLAGTYNFTDQQGNNRGIFCSSTGKLVLEQKRSTITGTVKSTGSCNGGYVAGWESPFTGTVTEGEAGSTLEFRMETCRFTGVVDKSRKRLGGTYGCLNGGSVTSQGTWSAVR
jgi:hypothetical protein